MTTNRLSVDIDIEDEAHQVVARVPVEVLYLTEGDQLVILDTAIQPHDLMHMNSRQVEYAIDRAWTIVQLTEKGAVR